MPTKRHRRQAQRPAVHEHALAAADVEQRARLGARHQLVERALEGAHQPAHDRVGRAVLVVGVARDDAVVGDRHAAHRRTASWRSGPSGSGSAAAGSSAGRSFVFVVRRGDAERELDAAHALEGLLRHHALRGEQVADHPQREQHDGRDEQHGAEDQRLHVALAVAFDVGDREAHPHGDRRHADQGGQAPEHAQRLVLGVDAKDRHGVAPHVGAHRREQARLARLGVGADRDVVDRHEQLARLDDRLQRVGELGDHEHLDRRLAVVGAKSGRRVRDRGGGGLSHDPRAQSLQRLLQRREVLDPGHLAVAHDHVRAALQDRLHETRDIRAVVLVVGVGVDDHVGAELQRRVDARLKARGQSLVVGQAHEVLDAVRRVRPRPCRRSSRRRRSAAPRHRSPRPPAAGRRASAVAGLPR